MSNKVQATFGFAAYAVYIRLLMWVGVASTIVGRNVMAVLISIPGVFVPSWLITGHYVERIASAEGVERARTSPASA